MPRHGQHGGFDHVRSALTLSQSDQTVAATSAADRITVTDLDQTGDVVTGFTVGDDKLAIHDASVAPSTH